jgi:hypothetical protein
MPDISDAGEFGKLPTSRGRAARPLAVPGGFDRLVFGYVLLSDGLGALMRTSTMSDHKRPTRVRGGVSMTRQAIIDRSEPIGTTRTNGDVIESELYASAREAGVACFAEPELDEDDDD